MSIIATSKFVIGQHVWYIDDFCGEVRLFNGVIEDFAVLQDEPRYKTRCSISDIPEDSIPTSIVLYLSETNLYLTRARAEMEMVTRIGKVYL